MSKIYYTIIAKIEMSKFVHFVYNFQTHFQPNLILPCKITSKKAKIQTKREKKELKLSNLDS